MYRQNIIGPNRDPWSTPQVSGAEGEDEFPIITFTDLYEKYDVNESKAVPRMPT